MNRQSPVPVRSPTNGEQRTGRRLTVSTWNTPDNRGQQIEIVAIPTIEVGTVASYAN